MKYLLTALLLVPISLFGQFSFTMNSGIGHYKMRDVRGFQNGILQDYHDHGIQAKETASFPTYWYYEFGSKMIFDNGLVIGSNISYYSTGGRVSYSDYSGSEFSDQALTGYSVASFIGYSKKFQNGSLILEGTISPTVFLSYLDLSSQVYYFGLRYSKDTESYSSKNLALQPTISLTKRYWLVGISISAGYFQSLKSQDLSYAEEDYNVYITNKHGDHIQADWSGIRLSAGILLYVKPYRRK